MSKKSSFLKIIILVTVLVLPGFLYFLLQEKGKNRYRPLDIFGPKTLASTFHTKRGKKIPDTIYHKVRDFKLINQSLDSLGIPTDSNHIVVVNFFFTRCKTFCPQMNAQMARVVEQYQSNRRLRFYSITVDPESDSPEVLRTYAKRLKADPLKWNFLTGERSQIFKIAKEDFFLDVLVDPVNKENVIHSSKLVLIDSGRKIRGYYDSTSSEQVDKLIDEIKVLITEELREVTSLKPLKK